MYDCVYGCVCECDTICVLKLTFIQKYIRLIRLNVDGSDSRAQYLEINDPYRTWQESFKVDELENSTC